MKKKIAIINISFLVEIPEEYMDFYSNKGDGGKEENFCYDIEHQIIEAAEAQVTPQISWESSRTWTYTANEDNISNCDNCGGWTTDSERSDSIKDISIGAICNGKLLCDECLPPEHHLAF